MNLFVAFIYGLIGIITGIFFSIPIQRISEREGFISGRLPRPLQHTAVGALTGMVFFLCRLSTDFVPQAVIMCLFGLLLITAAWIDACCLYIPDGINLLILLLAAVSMIRSSPPRIAEQAAGAVFCGGFLALLSILTKGGVGGGDIKLLGASGLLLGARAGMSAVLTAYVMAGLWYLIPLLRGKVNGKTQAPMAPFFALSLMIYGLWYNQIISWYMGLFLPGIH